MNIYTKLQQKKEFLLKRIYKLMVKRFFKSFGKGVRIDYRVKINNPENIEIGNHVSINWGVNLIAPAGIIIGDYCRISSGVKIINSGLNLDTFPREHISNPVVLEKNVWIATNALIVGGVTIGENSVVASGAVVTKDVPANVLVGGVPAKIIKELNI